MGVGDCPAAVSGNDRRQTHWDRSRGPGKRRPVGVEQHARRAHESEDLPAHRARRARWSEASWDGRRLVRRGPYSAAYDRLLLRDLGPFRRISRGRAMTITKRSPTMQVRKRNGDDEPVDVNKIVRAVDRVCDDLADVDPMRVATRTISGLYDGATTAELDRLSIQTAAEMIGEEPQYSRLAARLLAGYIDKEVRNQGVMSFSQSVALGHAEGLIGDETARFVKDNARKLDFAVDAGGRPPVRVLRAAHRLRPLPAPAPVQPAGRRDAAVLPAPRRLRAVPDAGRGDRVLPADVLAGLPAEQPDAVQLRHPAHPDVVLLPGRQPTRRPRLDLRPLPAGGPALEVRRRHRHRVLAGPLARRADPRDQRRLQRHRARSCGPSTRRWPRSTRAAGARARPASTSSRGTRTSRSSSS